MASLPKGVVSKVFLVLVVAASAAVGLGNPVPSNGPYLVTPCNGAGQPTCNVPFTTNPQPEPGLTNALFQSWFGSFGIPGASTGTYMWSVTDVNSSGVAIGQVTDVSILINTAFVFDQGKLTCCTTDLLHLNDINDNGFVVGKAPSGAVFDGFVSYCCGGLNAGQGVIPLTYIPPLYNLTGFMNFLGIDVSNSILAQTGTQQYELDPTPEPRSMVLFATALGLTVFLMRRRLWRLR
jgi:hypothetical protein